LATDRAADPTPLIQLTKRADFLRAARGRRVATPAFVVQCASGVEGAVRVGYTCSKKVGNAVARNRAKRRLREVARAVLPLEGQPGRDYVLIGRAGVTASRPLPQMISDLSGAIAKLNGQTT